jgi:hypothetical protein
MRVLRGRLTYANVVATLALAIAVAGGSAYAANTVLSSDIVDGEVKTADISNSNGVRSEDVRDDNLAGGGLAAADLRPDSVGTSEVAANSIGKDEVADNSLGGAEIVESTLVGLDASDGFDGFCDPSSTTYLDCAAAPTVAIDRPMNVLVIATSHFESPISDPSRGRCRLERNDVVVSSEHWIGDLNNGTDIGGWQGGMNLVDVQPLSRGSYTFEVSCNEVDGDIAYPAVRVAAVELAQG